MAVPREQLSEMSGLAVSVLVGGKWDTRGHSTPVMLMVDVQGRAMWCR